MPQPEIMPVRSIPEAGAQLFERAAHDSVAARGRFAVVLSGGNTPTPMFEQLRDKKGIPWEHILFFWGDERFVPYDDPRSNFGTAKRVLLDNVPVLQSHIFPWPHVDGYPDRCAAVYAELIEEQLAPDPTFDLTFLGLGADGHTASLFPGTGAALETGLTAVVHPDDPEIPRLTLTPTALSNSRTVAFLLAGEEKRDIARATLAATGDEDRYPARAISARERLIWLTDFEL